MKSKSHRVLEVCEKSGVERSSYTTSRRLLDGHSLYSAEHAAGPRESKPIVARFDQPHASSDGGAVLLKRVDDRLGLTWRLAGAIRDRRQPGKVAIRSGICCGSASSGWPVATPTATTPCGWPTTRSTSCCSTAFRSRARPWGRSRRRRFFRERRGPDCITGPGNLNC